MSNQAQTVSQLFGQNPQVDILRQLPKFQIRYEYPENFTPIIIENPADAITLFRALRSQDNQCGFLIANHFYILCLRNNTVLGIQLADISLQDVKQLNIAQVAKMAYIADATHLILFSTHNSKEVDDYPLSIDEIIRDMPETFEMFGLILIDYIRVSLDQDYSSYAQGYDEYNPTRRVIHEDDYNLRRKYLIA